MDWYEGPELSILKAGRFCAEVKRDYNDILREYVYTWTVYQDGLAMEWDRELDRDGARSESETAIKALIESRGDGSLDVVENTIRKIIEECDNE